MTDSHRPANEPVEYPVFYGGPDPITEAEIEEHIAAGGVVIREEQMPPDVAAQMRAVLRDRQGQ